MAALSKPALAGARLRAICMRTSAGRDFSPTRWFGTAREACLEQTMENRHFLHIADRGAAVASAAVAAAACPAPAITQGDGSSRSLTFRDG
jgi:hypothetical protein